MYKALVIGSGSYVIGDSLGLGVVMPSLMELSKQNLVDEIILIVRTPRSTEFWERVRKIGNSLSSKIAVKEVIINRPRDIVHLIDTKTISFIAVPDHFHKTYLEIFVDNQVPTWIVKPLTGSGNDSKELAIKSKKLEVPLWVDYHKRFDMSNLLLKKAIENNNYQNILNYSVQYSQPKILPLGDLKKWAKSVDVFQYIGCHYVDQIFFLFPNCKPIRISATGLKGYLSKNDGPEYDIINVILDLKNGHNFFRANFNVSWNDPNGSQSKSHQRLDIQFEDGRVIADQKNRGYQVWNSVKTEEINPYFFQIVKDSHSKYNTPVGYGFDSIRNFVNEITYKTGHDNSSLPWAWEAYRTDIVLDYANASLKASGDWIKFPENAMEL
jgi:predicted dehydrogenase